MALRTAALIRRPSLVAALLLMIALTLTPQGLQAMPRAHPASPGGTWTPTGSMTAARYSHTATLLPNGQVLVAGGYGSTCCYGLTSAELYDPRMGTWTPTGSMSVSHFLHTATLLPNGQVLVAGGFVHPGYSYTTELYDPHTGTWTPTGSMNYPRESHTATLLPNGQVLAAGGCCYASSGFSSAELYNPRTGTWTVTGSLTTARAGHTATLLPNGQVLVAGGCQEGYYGCATLLSSTELFNPSTGTWARTGSMTRVRYLHTATLLPNGQIFVAGGCVRVQIYGCVSVTASAEVYDPHTGTWTATESMTAAREFHTATLLSNGQVLVAGGCSYSRCLSKAELYDPSTGTWTAAGNMSSDRSYHTAILLPNGQVLVAGGEDSSGTTLASAELYRPAVPVATLLVTPASGAYTQPITLRGRDFAPSESIQIYGDATTLPPLYSTTTDATGSFVLRTTARQGYYGTHPLFAVGQSSGRLASSTFFVQPRLTLAPSSGASGATVTATGYGFGAGEPVDLYLNTPTGALLVHA